MSRENKIVIQITVVILIVFGILIALTCGGCDATGLRFAPSEAIKQNAELTHQLAVKIDQDGTDSESPASIRLVDGTATSLIYTGRPKVTPNPNDFDTINDQADSDAAERPEVGEIMDSALEIGLGIAGLIGGVGGVRLTQSLRKAHGKAKAFNEVVSQNDLFKKMASTEELAKFKRLLSTQTFPTQKHVAQARMEEKTQFVSVPKGIV